MIHAPIHAGAFLGAGNGRPPWSEVIFQAVYQGGLAMFVAGVAFTHAVKTFGPVRTTMVIALVPVLATLLAVPLLGEPITATAAIGLICVPAGLLIAVRAELVPMTRARQEEE